MENPSSPTFAATSIDVAPEHLQLVRSILRERLPGGEVWALGSRVRGTAKPASDLDLCIMGDEAMPPPALAGLRDAFNESALPFKVDIAEWATMSVAFREIVMRKSVRL